MVEEITKWLFLINFSYFISDHKILRIITRDIRAPVSPLFQHCLSVDLSFMPLGQILT
jgi:hypothetical protein